MTREQFEERERRELAPYAMKSAETRGREHPEPEHAYRTAYQRDRDRIVHSTAFRRLEYKTQVFVNHEGDYYRTRLTHTMEVAQLARAVARALELNEDLVETVALAHDLGHTPFGHSGEDALAELMEAHGGFEHNSQGLRIVEVLEERYPEFPGLNLSYEVRESIIKHRTRYDSADASRYCPEEGPLLEALVVDACDTIAYNNHDIDDGVKFGLLTPEQLMEVRLFREAWERAQERYPTSDRQLIMRTTVRVLIDDTVTDLIRTSREVIAAESVDSVAAVRACRKPAVSFSAELQGKTEELSDFLFRNLYRHYRVARMAEKAKRFVKEMWTEYVRYPVQLAPQFQRLAERDGLERAVCDFIAGMTDRYAQDEYKRLFHPFEQI